MTTPEKTSVSPVMDGARISKPTAWVMAILFLAIILTPAVHQFICDARAGTPFALFERLRAAVKPFPTHESLKEYENSVARDSQLSRQVRHGYQTVLTRGLKSGSESIFVGENGWLFFRQEIDFCAGSGFLSERFLAAKKNTHIFDASEDVFTRKFRSVFTGESPKPVTPQNRLEMDPVAAIADFAAQLESRGVHLIVVPVPVKPSIYPEMATAAYPVSKGPAWNSDRGRFFSQLAAKNVDVVDLTDVFWSAKSGGEPLYLKTDTHWSPRGLEIAADALAESVKSIATIRPSLVSLKSSEQKITAYGDLYDNLFDQIPDSANFSQETVTTSRITLESGEKISAGNDAPVLLLGDSYANIYSSPTLSWGEQAGLPQQLMWKLKVPVQTIAINGGGVNEVRTALARRPEMLAKKKVVIWEFSTRELYSPKLLWPLIQIGDTQGELASSLQVEAKIVEVAKLPQVDPPYPRAYWTIRVDVQKKLSGGEEKTSLYVLIHAMEKNQLTPLAQLRIGQTVKLTLRPPTQDENNMRRTEMEKVDVKIPVYLAERCEILP